MPTRPRENPVFVTVGTTSFDALVRALDTPRLVDALRRKGFTELTLQVGRGTHVPTSLTSRAGRSFAVRVVEYLPSIADEIARAGLVISHAGAGSVFETMRARKPLLVVTNATLMDNHQTELAEELASRGHCRWCAPEGVLEAIEALEGDGSGFRFTAYASGRCSFAERVEALLF
jgi:beta-1,4-N-acetylglucosaminyltransferase